MDIFFIGLLILLLVGFLFCGYMAWKAGQPCWTDTPEEARARAAMNKKLGL